MVKYLSDSTYTLPDRRYSVIHGTVQSLCLHNNKRDEAMNSYFTDTANSDVVQSPIALEPRIQAFNTASPVVDFLKFLSFRPKSLSLLVAWIYLDNRLGTVLAFYYLSQFFTTVTSITNDIFGVKFAIGKSRLAKQRGSNTNIMRRSSRNLSNDRQFVFGICQNMKLVTKVVFYLARCISLNSPTGIGVGHWLVSSVRPSLQIGTVDSYTFAKIRQGIVHTEVQRAFAQNGNRQTC